MQDFEPSRGCRDYVQEAEVERSITERAAHRVFVAYCGSSWIPPADEQDKARRLFVFLEDRRVLFNPFDMEVRKYVTHSILEIRLRLTHDLEDIPKDSLLGQAVTAMRAACRKFLDETQDKRSRHVGLGPLFMTCLGELRAIFEVTSLRSPMPTTWKLPVS